jgi:hypothetical protein
MHQDHQAHITVHMSAMQDPKMAQMIGQNPQAQAIQAAALAHINEHLAFAYRRQIEEQLGTELPAPDEKLSEEVEVQLSALVAQAAQQLLAKNQNEAQQQQAQQQAQDPMVQMQQQELQLKAQEIQIKADKTKADIELDKAKLQIDVMRIQSDERKAGAQLGSKNAAEKAKLQAAQQEAGVRMGIDIAKTKAQHWHQGDALHQADRHKAADIAREHAAQQAAAAQAQQPKEE